MRIFLLLIITLLIFGCKKTADKESYIEATPSFYSIRHESFLSNRCMREPENLLMIHQTFKSFGYEKLLTGFVAEKEFLYQDVYIKKSLDILLDSLEKSYYKKDSCSKYYREFWDRRKTEKNDSIIYLIVKDINSILKNNTKPFINEKLVNDTLLNLLKVEFTSTPITDEQALENFTRLRDLGFHQSAYNLLYERYNYYDVMGSTRIEEIVDRIG